MKLKHIGVWSLTRMTIILYAICGFVVGGIMSIFSLLGAAIGRASGSQGAEGMAMLFGVGAVFFMPVMYAVFGGVGVAFSTWLYNLLAGAVGGVELDLEA